MIFLVLIPIIYICIKLLLYFIVCKFGKLSYKDFSAAGFKYDSNKDIFYTAKNAWQKNFGYSHIYDVLAPLFRMIIDTEPIKFYYNNKNYLITFWKGQYGIVTGAEVGIYATRDLYPSKNTLYLPVTDDEMLDISCVLYKNGQKIVEAHAKHWWLAIFKLGMFSKPKELTMDIKLKFPSNEMLNSFLKSFIKLGYKDTDYRINDNTFIFSYKKPKTHKVWTRTFLNEFIAQSLNKKNVKLYNKYILDTLDNKNASKTYGCSNNIIKVQDLIPEILKNKPYNNEYQNIVSKVNNSNVLILKEDIYPYKKEDKDE